MSAPEGAVRHLEAAREELLRERTELDRHIAELDGMILKFSGRPSLEARAVATVGLGLKSGDGDDRPPPMRKAVRNFLMQADGRLVPAGAIVADLVGEYGWSPASVRKALMTMSQSGEIERAERGLYRLAAPTNADSPTETAGLSDTLDLSPEGGEHTDGQEGSHHDHRVDFAGRDGDRDHLGAPVGH